MMAATVVTANIINNNIKSPMLLLLSIVVSGFLQQKSNIKDSLLELSYERTTLTCYIINHYYM